MKQISANVRLRIANGVNPLSTMQYANKEVKREKSRWRRHQERKMVRQKKITR